jgi:hypothetical protein
MSFYSGILYANFSILGCPCWLGSTVYTYKLTWCQRTYIYIFFTLCDTCLLHSSSANTPTKYVYQEHIHNNRVTFCFYVTYSGYPCPDDIYLKPSSAQKLGNEHPRICINMNILACTRLSSSPKSSPPLTSQERCDRGRKDVGIQLLGAEGLQTSKCHH